MSKLVAIQILIGNKKYGSVTNQQSELVMFIQKRINQILCTVQPATLLTYRMTLLGWFWPLLSKNI